MGIDAEHNNTPSTAKRALRALQEMQARLAGLEEAQREPIAIIGMGCRLPGARNVEDFWEMLCEGRNGITEVPAERWDVDAFFNPDPKVRGKVASRWGGFVEGLDRFDAQFFGISPREAPHLDPRQRLILEVTWEALEDAGIPPSSLAGTQTGVFVAALSNDYDFITSRDYTRITSFTGSGTANSIVANRVSYFLDLRGPSIALDTACSGSLLTIDLACRSLRSGESSLALAGGVSVNLLPRGDIFFSQAGALSPDGRCQAFDSRANGIVRSEGAGVVVLKPLSRALADRDRIYALIRGGAVNHDGRSNGIMAPNGLAQEAMLREAYRLAGVAPASVQFVETHGTGTPLGDPIEVKALGNVLGEGRPADRPCILGSVKTNLGHLESSAGVAGVIKTALALHHRQIPPNLHFEELNPLIAPTDFPMTVQTELTAWPVESESLIAGVSGFSFGGTNVHLVLEEAPRSPHVDCDEEQESPFILPLSGKSPEALRGVCREYQRFLEAAPAGTRITDICYTAGARRSHHDYRLAVIGKSTGEIAQRLSAWLNPSGESSLPGYLVEGTGGREDGMRLVFVFSGQGSHSPGMGRELFEREGVFRDALNELDMLFRKHVSWSLREELFAAPERSRLNETDIGQPAVFAIQMALVALWRSWGVVPAAVIGQSLGEVAGACAAGALTLKDGVSVVFHRSRLMRATSGKGLTAVVGLPPSEAGLELAAFNGDLSVAGSSGPTSSVVSGEPRAVRLLVERLGSKNIFCRVIDNVDVAFHSPQMDPLGVELEASLSEIHPQLGAIPFYSTVTRNLLEGVELGAGYWSRNLREPFRFAEVVGQLIGLGYDSFLEISPHTVLSGAIRQTLLHARSNGTAIPTLIRGEGEESCLRQALGKLYVEGYEVDFGRQYGDSSRLIGVPGYVWQRERYWHDEIEGGRGRRASVLSKAEGDHPFVAESLCSSLGSGQFFWETELGAENLGYLKDHRIQGAIVIPGAAYLEMGLAAVAQRFPSTKATLKNADFDRALILADDDVRTVQLVLNPTQAGDVSFKVFSTSAGEPSVGEKERTKWTEHAAMRILVDQSGGASRHVSLSELKSRIAEELDAEEHYREMQSRKFNFGPSFRAIRGLWHHGDEALSLVELPESLAASAGSYQIHPVIIDAGFQTIAATVSRAAGETFLPKSVKHLRVFARPGSRLWCHVKLAASESSPETLVAEIDLIDESGNVLVEIQGLTLKRLDTTRIETDVRDSLYEIKWRHHPVDESLRSSPTGRWLILADRGGLGEAIATRLADAGDSSIIVRTDKRSELEQIVVEQGSGVGEQGLAGIIHLWSLDAGSFEDTGLAGLDLAQQLGPLSALAVIRGLSRLESRATTRLWMVTRGAQSVGERRIDVLQSGLWGLGRTLAVEHPEMCGGLIDVDQTAGVEETAREILLELMRGDEERETAWRDGERYVPRLMRLEERKAETAPVQCRSDSSYLVSGGLSGLGLEAARWLIARGARRLIIVGRRGLPARAEWKGLAEGTEEWQRVEAVKDLERMGASIEYWAANVGDEEEMRRRWGREEAEGRPGIRGIIHAAGVIEDALAMRMSEEVYERVQEGKVRGAFVLNELSRDLDFFIGYSSVSGVLGQVGQGNYAAANAYLDGLMDYRRQEGNAALSIAWGPWAEVGMWARSTFVRGDSQGPGGITTAMGAEILALAFKSSAPQVVVLNGDPRELRRTRLLEEVRGGSAFAQDALETGSVSSGLSLELLLATPVERQAMLESVLREEVSRVMRSGAEHLSLRKPLPNLGLDSIMAVELKNSVEARLGLTVSMVDLFTASIAQLIERLEEQLENDERLLRALAEIEQLSLDEVSVMLAEKPVRKKAP